MPNRIIKETIRTSDTLSSVSSDAERLFWRLVVSVDDFGRFDARPNVVLGQCLSSFIGTVLIEQVKGWLRELARVQLINIYRTKDGGLYLQLTNWSRHQTIRAKKSKFPSQHEVENNCEQMLANVSVFENGNVFENVNDLKELTSPDDEGDESKVKPDGAHPSDGKAQKRPAEKSEDYTAEFDTFWNEYPRKVDKKTAFAKWKARIRSQSVTWDKLVEAAKNYATYCKLMQTDVIHIMHGSTFLGPNDRYVRFVEAVPEEAYQHTFRATITAGGKANERTRESPESSEYDESIRDAFFAGWKT